MKINIPADAKHILRKLHDAGYKAYVVGGCVRDSLLGIPPKDWDICTSATPEQMLAVFQKDHVIPTGLKHGTLTIMRHKVPYEVTTFRVDGNYSDGRHPDTVTFSTDLLEDLSRRDFTINAMAYNEEEGLIDPFGGQNDLKEKVIRCVGNAEERFEEDALRVLRALRFAARYDFKIHIDTDLAIIDTGNELSTKISAERIREEFCKIMTAKPNAVRRMLAEYPYIFETFIPELRDVALTYQRNPWHCFGVWAHTVQAIRHCESKDLVTRLAVFFHDFGKPQCLETDENGIDHFRGHGEVSAKMTDEIMRRLKFDNDTREKVVELVRMHDNVIEPTRPAVKRLLNKIGEEQIERLITLRITDVKAQNPVMENGRIEKAKQILSLSKEILREQNCFSLKDLAVNGNDLLALGFQQGEELGETLQYLLNEVVEENLPNDRETLLLAARHKYDISQKSNGL